MSTAEVRIEQEELETIKHTVLTRSRRLLVDSIDPANHVSYLRSKFIFSERDAEEINAPPSRSARAELFLDKLSHKGSQAYDEFQNSLCRDKTQLFLLTHMTKTLELLKHRLRDFKVQQRKQHQEQLMLQRRQYQSQQQQQTHQVKMNYFQPQQQPQHQRPPNYCQPHVTQQQPQHQRPPNYCQPHVTQQQPQHQRPPNYCQPLQQPRMVKYSLANGVHHQQRMNYSPPILAQPGQKYYQPHPAPLQQGAGQLRHGQPNGVHQHQRIQYGQPQMLQQFRPQHQVQHPNYSSQPLNGFSPPPRYQPTNHTITPPKAPPSHPHYQHSAHPHQNPPDFHSRDPDSGTDDSDNSDTTNERDEQGSPHSSDAPSGQPCGQTRH